jgi:hypothetical protein
MPTDPSIYPSFSLRPNKDLNPWMDHTQESNPRMRHGAGGGGFNPEIRLIDKSQGKKSKLIFLEIEARNQTLGSNQGPNTGIKPWD